MKICWFGIYEPSYSRNDILIAGLRQHGVEIVECNVKGGGLKNYVSLIRKLLAYQNEYDLLYCAFPVHFSILVAKIFQRKKIVADAFFPKYDGAVYDRKTVSKYNPVAWGYWVIDYLMVVLADHVIADTLEHKLYWSKFIPDEKVTVIPIGVNTERFYPDQTKKIKENFIVQYHGSYIPLQGLDHIVDAAVILREHKKIHFRFIGAGQLFEEITSRAKEGGAPIEFIPWAESTQLLAYLQEADIILGIFGDTPKTDRVVPNKLYEGLAVRKTVITKDTRTIRNYFEPDEIYMIHNDASSIANSILKLYEDEQLCDTFAEKGYQRVVSSYTHNKLGQALKATMQSLLM